MARSMAPLYDGHDYYRRMFELQEKLRKSEEERIRLEERFNVLMRESRNKHDVCINRLRMKYIQYLEEQRTRDERNHKLLTALDKVMNKLALISAKKDRLNVLRKQYEAYLLRVYANHRAPGSTTGDSGIASQNEDKYTKKIIAMAHPDLAETRSVSSPRVHSGAPFPQSSQPRSTSASKFHDQITANASLNNPPPILSATPLSATLDADHRQSVLREPYVYVSVPNAQHPRMISNYNESAPNNLQHIPNIRVSYAEAPVLSIATSDNMHAVPTSRFFREHVESAQPASGLSTTARFPAGDTARYEKTSQNVPVPRQFNPLLQYHDTNILLPDPRSQRRGYDPSDSAVMGPTLVTEKLSTYRTGSDVNIANQIGPLPGYMDYILASSQKSDDEGSIRSITSDDLDGLIRRNERLLWSNADIAKTPHRSPTASGVNHANLDENGMTAIVENELDRYISNIRKLHREHGVQSLDELDHEQNTSGDLLNVSLSEDALELSAEDRAKKERMPEEMGKILALASDLASRTANLKEIARDSAGQNGSDSSLTETADGIRREIAKSDASEFKGKCEAEGRATLVKNEIRDDVATHSAKLEQPRENTEIAKENWNNADDSAESRERDREVSAKKNNANEEITTTDESQIDDLKNASREKQLDLVTGQESNIEGMFDAAEELAPWDLASVQRKVRDLHLDDSDEDRVAEKNVENTADKIREDIVNESRDSPRFVEHSEVDGEVENARPSRDSIPRSETETKKLDVSEVSEIKEQNKTHDPIDNVENVDIQNSQILNQQSAGEAKIASQPGEEFGESDGSDRRKQDNEELQAYDQFASEAKDNEYNVEQGYIEDPSQTQQYEQQNLNQQYYDPNIPYEAGNKDYDRYADQGYAQDGQQYVEYVDGQYEQYPEDLNNQQYQDYSNAQYEQDPNQAYDYGYDPNQGYGDPGQQYDPNQGYENNPDNQAYYTEQVPYDSNQAYDTYEEEYKEEQRNPDNPDNVEDRAEKPETEEASQGQADTESGHKSDGDEDKSKQADAVNGASQSMKKKDVIKSLLDSDTDTTIERNVSNTESDFDFN